MVYIKRDIKSEPGSDNMMGIVRILEIILKGNFSLKGERRRDPLKNPESRDIQHISHILMVFNLLEFILKA